MNVLTVYCRAQQLIRPLNPRPHTWHDPALPFPASGSSCPKSHVGLEPSAASPVHPAALFPLSNEEPRVHRKPRELARLKTAELPREARNRGSGLALQISHRNRRQKKIYRQRFFSGTIGQDACQYIDAYVSSLTQIRLAADLIIKFAETYERNLSLQTGPLNVPESLPTHEEVSGMLSYAGFLGLALQQQRYNGSLFVLACASLRY